MDPSARDDSSIAPGFLVASPKLDGGPFERAVILLVHHDSEGAMGYIVNKPVRVDFGTLIASVNEDLNDDILPMRFEQRVFFGGPVRTEQLWLLIRRGQPTASASAADAAFEGGDPTALDFETHWRLSSTGHVIERFAVNDTGEFIMPMLGYAGWGGGQLESEVEEGAWLMADFEEELLRSTPADACWERALEEIGVGPTAFLMMGSVGSA